MAEGEPQGSSSRKSNFNTVERFKLADKLLKTTDRTSPKG
jgi:hypothetical protein